MLNRRFQLPGVRKPIGLDMNQLYVKPRPSTDGGGDPVGDVNIVGG